MLNYLCEYKSRPSFKKNLKERYNKNKKKSDNID